MRKARRGEQLALVGRVPATATALIPFAVLERAYMQPCEVRGEFPGQHKCFAAGQRYPVLGEWAIATALLARMVFAGVLREQPA